MFLFLAVTSEPENTVRMVYSVKLKIAIQADIQKHNTMITTMTNRQ